MDAIIIVSIARCVKCAQKHNRYPVSQKLGYNQGRNFTEAMKAMAVVAPQFGPVPLKEMA